MESVSYWPTTLSMRSALQCDLYAQCYSLEKSLFPLSKSYQLGMASWLGWDFMSRLPPPCWGFVWLELVRVLWMLSLSLWFQRWPIVSGKCCFLKVIHSLWISCPFWPVFYIDSLNLDTIILSVRVPSCMQQKWTWLFRKIILQKHLEILQNWQEKKKRNREKQERERWDLPKQWACHLLQSLAFPWTSCCHSWNLALNCAQIIFHCSLFDCCISDCPQTCV